MCAAPCFPDDIFDVLFAVGAQVFSETKPVKIREASPQVVTNFLRVELSDCK
jgi:hypothetical protein